jgi:hypothetical protein
MYDDRKTALDVGRATSKVGIEIGWSAEPLLPAVEGREDGAAEAGCPVAW